MEELKEERKSEERDLVAAHPSLLQCDPKTWLMLTYEENGSEEHLFYSPSEERCYVRFIPDLQNKYVACSNGEWLVLKDKSTDDCSILNVLTMEKLQLPPLNIPPHKKTNDIYAIYNLYTDCVMSSHKMDTSCRLIFFERSLCKFWSCHLGDSEFVERELTYRDGLVSNLINFKGKLYAMTHCDHSLIAFDFSDPDLHYEQVITIESLPDFIRLTGCHSQIYLVESYGDLLLLFIRCYAPYGYEVSDVLIFKADFRCREWVKLETLGDRAIFLHSCNNTLSSPASTVGMKGNVVYWVTTPYSDIPSERLLYIYDIEDKSISMALPFPIVGTWASLSWLSFPMSFFSEAAPFETNFHVQRGKATLKSTELQNEQGKIQKREETETVVGSTMVRKARLWADLPDDLLLEIFPHLIAGDKVSFRLVRTSWYSLSPFKTTQQCVLPLKISECSSFPLLMCPDNKIYHPIHSELYSMDFPDIPGAKVRAARDGWLLMDYYGRELFFYNPFTKAKRGLPDCDALFYYSVSFSAPPTSKDCVVVVSARRWDGTDAIYFKKFRDVGWTCHKISIQHFLFSYCNAVVYKGLYFFLANPACRAKLLIFNPEKNKVRVIEDAELISKLKDECDHQYMLETDDGKLIAVFVGADGSLVYTCEWNVSTSKWDVLESLGNLMLFVSRPLSICKRATTSGTGNKIYFPRVVDDGHILFYSLATKRYHTFEMGTSYPNFLPSKYYTQYNGWFMP